MTTKVKAKYLFLFGILNFTFYFLIQAFISHNSYDLLTSFDLQIPLLPSFIWIYSSLIPVFIVTMLCLLKPKKVFLSALSSFFIASIILSSCYVLMPTHYPRDLWQVDDNTISGQLLEITRTIDSPGNCLPSGHNTFAWLLVLFVCASNCVKQHGWLKPAFFIWGVLISVSTLVLKQHYIADVVSGVALALLCYYFVQKVITPSLSEN